MCLHSRLLKSREQDGTGRMVHTPGSKAFLKRVGEASISDRRNICEIASGKSDNARDIEHLAGDNRGNSLQHNPKTMNQSKLFGGMVFSHPPEKIERFDQVGFDHTRREYDSA